MNALIAKSSKPFRLKFRHEHYRESQTCSFCLGKDRQAIMMIMSKKTIKSELLPKKWTIAFHPLTGGSLGNSETGKKERVYDGNIKIRIFQLLLNVSGSGPLWSNVHHYSSGLIILLRLAELREPFCRVNQRNCNLIIMRIWLSMTTIDALTARL